MNRKIQGCHLLIKYWVSALKFNEREFLKMNVTRRDLQKAICLVEKVEYPDIKQDAWRLAFHLMPPVGWLNDPNGLCYYQGQFHVFFQYAPFNAKGGLKVWGHYVSLDLVNWEYKGAPILPDQAEDSHGVYSGCTFIEGDKAYLYYTGNVKRLGDFDYTYTGREANTILIETDDLFNFKEKECIMTSLDYGDELSCHVRDPKVWKEDETYYMVQGARTMQDKGEVLVFESKDRRNWSRINKISTPQTFGYMWECPDLFTIDDVTILSVSPQGIAAEGLEFWNVYQSGYFVVEGDFRSDYTLGRFRELDRGFDFYAPQTFKDEKGRRILIGWMGLPDCEPEYTNPTVKKGWQHCLTLPRELRFKNGKLYQTPVKELEVLRKQCQKISVRKSCEVRGNTLDEIVITDIDDRDDLKLVLNKEVMLSYSKDRKEFTLQFLNESGAGRDKRMVSLDILNQIQVFRDHSAIEIFINEGEEVFSTRYYPDKRESVIELNCQSATLTIWELGEMSYGIQ